VSQVSKRLRESDLIHKAYNPLARTLETENTKFVEMEDAEMFESEDTDDEEIENDDDLIESKLIGKPLFCVHLNPKNKQEFVECLAGKSVKKARQLHPIIYDFIYEKQFDRVYPLFGEKVVEIFTEYKRNGTTYRAHPNYNSCGEWYDWTMIRFEMEYQDNEKKGVL